MSEPRKATDVLLEMEQKLDVALNIIRAQDLNIKILSNKLNTILEALEKKVTEPPKIMVEAVNTTHPPVMSQFQQFSDLDAEKQIPVSAEFKLPLESEPKGFRRTSRPETFAGDDVYLSPNASAPTQPQPPPGRGPMTPPPGRTAEVVVPPSATKKVEAPAQPQPPVKQAKVPVNIVQNAIPVQQRVVNAHGKSLFLADVEIIDLSTMQQVFKTRTNGTGKWMASLGIGTYRVIIRKLEAATKERLEAVQEIEIDGSQSPLELQTIIIKS